MRRWKWTIRLGGALAAATLGVGLLHLPAARPLLTRLGACPVGRASASEIEEARRIALRSLRGDAPAPARPALGFELERTTLDDVRGWARARAIACDESRESTLLVCRRVQADALESDVLQPIDEVAFVFRVRDRRLVNVTTLTAGVSPRHAADSFAAIAAALSSSLGAPEASRLPPQRWDGTRPAFVRYRYLDYVADVSAMQLPGRGIVMREQYMSASESGS
ncbi:MAG TPA: hypothetical protein VKD69_18175 [Vicinamibacterales bacterium]|nr:hypothetical protein [Vicinamibacterales bacterium]